MIYKTINIPQSLHKELKLYATNKDTALSKFVCDTLWDKVKELKHIPTE